MSLETFRVSALVAVSDMERARGFYEGKLGLTARGDDPDGGRTYACGEQTILHVSRRLAALVRLGRLSLAGTCPTSSLW